MKTPRPQAEISRSFEFSFIVPSAPCSVFRLIIRDSAISAQISVLNTDYSGSGLSFVLAGTTRTVNSDWFNNVDDTSVQQDQMKSALHVGGAATLNLYSVG